MNTFKIKYHLKKLQCEKQNGSKCEQKRPASRRETLGQTHTCSPGVTEAEENVLKEQ